MNKTLFVYYKNKLVGSIKKKSDDTITFSYSEKWLSAVNNFPLSPALELREDAFNNRETRAFFENLLPEGDLRIKLEKIFKRNLTDCFNFLNNYGVDCAGALIITSDESYVNKIDPDEVQKISISNLQKAYKNGEDLAIYSYTGCDAKFSLAGAQDKIPVIFYKNNIYLPIKGGATSHIIKSPIRVKDTYETVYNEYYCMKLAHAIGLDVADVDIIEGSPPFYLVNRFDREIVDGHIERIHQYDFCQAQGYSASEKYEEDGGPGVVENYNTIKRLSNNIASDLDGFVRWVSYNIIIGNNDSHSKNLSFLSRINNLSVSPYYDLISTSIYKVYDNKFAFQIGGQRQWNKLKKRNFDLVMQSLGFKKNIDLFWGDFIKTMNLILEKSDVVKKDFVTKYGEKKVINEINKEISKRIHHIKKINSIK